MQWFGTGPRAGLRLKKRGGDTVVKPTPTKLIGQGWDEGWEQEAAVTNRCSRSWGSKGRN